MKERAARDARNHVHGHIVAPSRAIHYGNVIHSFTASGKSPQRVHVDAHANTRAGITDIQEPQRRRIGSQQQTAGVEHDQRVGHRVKDVLMEAIDFQNATRTPG